MQPKSRATALIVGKFAPPHKGHQYLIETALQNPSVDNWIILVYSKPDFLPNMPSYRRACWLQHLYPQATVCVPENPPPNEADDFTQREFIKQWLVERQIKVNFVYTSEHYGEGFAKHIGAEHVLVDLSRSKVAVSGTQIRELMQFLEKTRKTSSISPHEVDYDFQSLHQLKAITDPYIFKQLVKWLEPVKRVVFMGAESTGKSTLTKAIAKELNMPFIDEYGRKYYKKKDGVLNLYDYVYIAQKHRELEDATHLQVTGTKQQGFLFIDTNAITTLFFSYYYNQGGLPELHRLANDCKDRYHYVFVCADDIPFEQDGWRDNDVWRSRMQGMVLHDLDCRSIDYTMLTGDLKQRIEQVKSVLSGQRIQTVSSLKHLGPKPI